MGTPRSRQRAGPAAILGRRRAGPAAILGRRRAQAIATRLGVSLREARQIAGLRQAEAAARADISQPRWSELERGLGHGATLGTWAVAASVVGGQLAAFLERLPGADRPRDAEHLKRQAALIGLARAGDWTARPELAARFGDARPLSIDVALVRSVRAEAVAVEVWDWFDDVGASFRGLGTKVLLLKQLLDGEQPDIEWRVRGLFVIRGTRRNRMLVAHLRALFEARFGGSSAHWLEALSRPRAALPEADGMLWSDGSGVLHPVRRGPWGRRARIEP
jgi:transcriptional regulator with XRE-family HTH domain